MRPCIVTRTECVCMNERVCLGSGADTTIFGETSTNQRTRDTSLAHLTETGSTTCVVDSIIGTDPVGNICKYTGQIHSLVQKIGEINIYNLNLGDIFIGTGCF